MKNFIFAAMLLFVCANFAQAQETRFGLTAGYLNAQLKVSEDGFNVSDNASGFYVGALADVAINESFHITPGVNYANAEDSGFLYIPVMAQYYIAESGFYFQAGPQATLSLEEDVADAINTFGLDAAFGAGYEINENFFVEAKYSLELTNRLSDEVRELAENADLKLNSLLIGVGYKF